MRDVEDNRYGFVRFLDKGGYLNQQRATRRPTKDRNDKKSKLRTQGEGKRKWSYAEVTVTGKQYLHGLNVLEIPLDAWGESCFSQIISTVGKFLKVDIRTVKMDNIEYARLFVHVPNYKKMLCEKKEIQINAEFIRSSLGSQEDHNEWLLGLEEEKCEAGNLEEDDVQRNDENNGESVCGLQIQRNSLEDEIIESPSTHKPIQYTFMLGLTGGDRNNSCPLNRRRPLQPIHWNCMTKARKAWGNLVNIMYSITRPTLEDHSDVVKKANCIQIGLVDAAQGGSTLIMQLERTTPHLPPTNSMIDRNLLEFLHSLLLVLCSIVEPFEASTSMNQRGVEIYLPCRE
ncbi:hypothetical protein VNO78_11437 [Psophocarpus tetragonolobus]|uniref:DUF4283 domain-containing protein n=1 Tax=Psophocarpus tetragonolobus TaxID=3891 RepID=A0AAN9SP88_PSOTE